LPFLRKACMIGGNSFVLEKGRFQNGDRID
jgi:hypothetical protein